MVADAVVYHPAVSHYLKFVATTVGRDKLLRTIQYFARFYAWYLLRTNRPAAAVQPWEAVKKQFGLVRKVLRAGKNVEHFKAAAVAADARNMDPVLRYAAVGRQLGYAGYLTFDLATLLDTLGVRKSPATKRFQREAFRFWAMGLACSVVAQTYTLYRLRQREARVDRKEGEGVVESKRIVLERAASRLQLTSDLCDLAVPLSALNWISTYGAPQRPLHVSATTNWLTTTRPSSALPPRPAIMAAPAELGELGLSIVGLGSEYPPYSLKPDALETLARKYYPESPAMQKVLAINRYTGIDYRSSIGTADHPLVNQDHAPSITELHKIFMSDGVPLAIGAARKALAEARIEPAQVTHVVSTTCTNSANPGYDHFVAKALGLGPGVEKVLLHGCGCSGGLAALRTAANLCLGHAMRGKPARILVVALEVSTSMVRSELDSINATQETRIGVALFSDCGSAVVLSNGIADHSNSTGIPPPIYELLGWEHRVIPDTEEDLGFDVDPIGWKVVLSPRVPKLTQAVLAPTYAAMMNSLPPLPKAYQIPADFDWAMHPGGATILTGAEKAMNISPEHMRASYDTYIRHGNSSSATIFSVLDRLRSKEMDELAPGGRVRDFVIGCAFGPGITVEMCMLKRNMATGDSIILSGLQTPPETESEAGSGPSEDGIDEDEDEPRPHGQGQDGTNAARTAEDAFINEAMEHVELD
ncbi:peroxisomal biogenesis factor 11-domain-containing protein [Lasiosphaeria miniovina]|uniref:Peroxisomal biogenesis factor 11-domain-containing protein n=1 Tax=Lasiosphaeria miniovina TaxID=1954250 RepID=A0AA40DQH0_9PEZI|nr:peroxisomal biogenesis factor 11-domain-containing protein [Lasiosphaeria miniovina]KAK0709507.1 peroxisomal biogenesis factor 11-domain-containing protein [Lasiosphaeria miniovina]